MATPDHKRDLIGELLRIPPPDAHSYLVPVRSILIDIPSATRAELLAVVGTVEKPLTIGGWRISYDEQQDRVRFIRPKPAPPPQPAVAKTASAPPPVTRPTPPPMDPITVGQKAQQYQREQRAKGREISATEAVAHIMAQNK